MACGAWRVYKQWCNVKEETRGSAEWGETGASDTRLFAIGMGLKVRRGEKHDGGPVCV